MASPNSTFTELVTTTLRNHPNEVSDNVSGNNALYSRLKSKGKIKKLSGGTKIVRPLDYAENSTYQRFSGYDTLNISASDVLSAAEFDWVEAVVHVVASGRELLINSGDEQIIDLAMARTKNAMRTAANNMSVDLYSDGALTNQMGGLASIIQNAGAGTVGGIDSATYTFWKNKFREYAGTNTEASTTIAAEMMGLWMTLVRGADKPNLIVSSQDFFSLYWQSLTNLQRYTSDGNSANAGFTSLKFNDCDVIFDSNSNFGTTAEKMYFLNTEYLELCQHSKASWEVEEEKISLNQKAVVIPMYWMGNLTCSNRSLQGVLIDAA